MNYKSFIYLSLLVLSFCCNAAELQNNHRSIPFNRKVVGSSPFSIHYNTDKDFIIAGTDGFEIQHDMQKGHSIFKNEDYSWCLVKDKNTVVAFTTGNIVIVDLNDKAQDMISLPQKNGVQCVALDSDKKTIFIGYNTHLSNSYADIRKSGIRKYCYNSHLYTDFNYAESESSPNSMVLSSNKDLLYVFSGNTISVFNTNGIASVLKQDRVPVRYPSRAILFDNKIAICHTRGFTNLPCRIIDIDINGFKLLNSCYPPFLGCYEDVSNIAFHSSGLLALLVTGVGSGSIQYWDIMAHEKIDTTLLSFNPENLCFRDDGCKVTIASSINFIEQPVSFKVIKQYILLPLWLKLKSIQAQCNLPQDIIMHCMNRFIQYYNQ